MCACSVPQSSLTLPIPWTVARQAPLSMGFSRKEYWSGLPFPTPRDLPNPEIRPACLASPSLAGDSLPLSPQGRFHIGYLGHSDSSPDSPVRSHWEEEALDCHRAHHYAEPH